MSGHKILRVGITQGDINGIGPEIIIKALADNRMTELMTPIIYGTAKVFGFYKKNIKGADGFSYHLIKSPRDARQKKVNFIETGHSDVRIDAGTATPESGEAAAASLRAAVEDLKKGDIDVLVTAPISKENMQGKDFNFTGHTEYMASEFGGEPLMLMCSDLMRVGLATIHIPVSKVSETISKELIVSRLNQLKNVLISDFKVVEPRIAVLSLNPHNGDGGLLGREEEDIIKPAIREAFQNGVMAFGPFSSDGFFSAGSYGKYDAVLAMYHDQGLAPFKALTPYGVNFTASLPVIRTSPDHGVAYDIADKDMADPDSMREAMYLATDIYRNRAWYEHISQNPLQHYERERGADISVKDLQLPEDTEH